MEPVTVTGPFWPGFSKIKHLVIFGDSYCDVGYTTDSPHPTLEDPLGLEYPGFTWAGYGMPNWVGHLITEYNPNGTLLVYNFARGGDVVAGVKRQVRTQFLRVLAKKPEWAPWTAGDTLFVTWIGINDCAWGSEHKKNMEDLFSAQNQVYAAGARNFLFIDVPPIHRSPAVGGNTSSEARYKNWNEELKEAVRTFSTTHPDVTTMIFSSWDTFTRVLDDPTAHGCETADEALEAGGAIWVDRLHPTSNMHDYIARDIAQFLNAQPAYTGEENTAEESGGKVD